MIMGSQIRNPKVHLHKLTGTDTKAAIKPSLNEILDRPCFQDVRRVLIKPNLVNGSPAHSGVTTDLKLVSSLVEILRAQGISEISVGDSTIEGTAEVFEALGVYNLKKLGVRVVNFDKDEWITVESPLGLALKRFRIAREVLESDLIISAAKMKTHAETGVTLSIKNCLGMISSKDRQAAHRTDIDEAIVDVYSYLKKNKKVISVVDAMWALEGRRGPIAGDPVKMDLVVAGTDPLAVDAVCVDVMGYNPRSIPHLALAHRHGLGEFEGVEVNGLRIEDVRRKFQMPNLLPTYESRLASYALQRVFKKRAFLRYPDSCSGCRACAESCPVEAMEIVDGKASVPTDRCIGCLVCMEACRQGALDYKMRLSWAYGGARALYRCLR